MFRRKNKKDVEQGSDRRLVQRSGGASPAFSYYSSSRRPDTPRMRRQEPPGRTEGRAAGERRWQLPFRLSGQLSFWLLLALLAVCIIKVLWLSTDPKVIVLGKNAVTDTYQQSADVYAAAAHKLLSSSLTNHSKLTINLNGTAAALQREFPELQTVSLDVPLVSSRPLVYVQLAQPSLIVQTTHGNYALNSSGVVLARVQSLPAGIPLAVDQSGTTPKIGSHFLPGSIISFVQTLAFQFQAAHIAISTYVLPAQTPYEIDARPLDHSYVIRFNLQADATVQSGAAIGTIGQLGGAAPGTYLDVRTPGRVYYK